MLVVSGGLCDGFMVIYFTLMETKGSTLEEIYQVAADWKTVKRSLRRGRWLLGRWNEGVVVSFGKDGDGLDVKGGFGC